MACSSPDSSRRFGLEAAIDESGDSDDVFISVVFNQKQSYQLPVQRTSTIQNLKSLLSKKTNLPPRSINLVLAGQLLQDGESLEHYNVGSSSILHAFCWSDDGLQFQAHDVPLTKDFIPATSLESEESDSLDAGSSVDGPRSEEIEGSGDASEAAANKSASPRSGFNRFFVFCKLCDCIQPAVLRVKCQKCENGAFIVHKNPSDWADISSRTSLRGTCTGEGCLCDIPSFYTKCRQRHTQDTEGTAVLLKHVQANYKTVECIICGIISSHILIFPCPPGHVICLTCFQEYGDSYLRSRQFVEHEQYGYTLPCPAGCPDSLVEETHHFLLLGKERYERYKNFGAEEYVLKNGGVLCPGPDCGAGLFPDGDTRYIKCEECKFESCRTCRMEYHRGSCQDRLSSQLSDFNNLSVDDERALRACWDSQSLSFIDESTKACPGCGTKTERSGGCMHMECSRCRQEWCWICVKPWNRDCQSQHWFG